MLGDHVVVSLVLAEQVAVVPLLGPDDCVGAAQGVETLAVWVDRWSVPVAREAAFGVGRVAHGLTKDIDYALCQAP